MNLSNNERSMLLLLSCPRYNLGRCLKQMPEMFSNVKYTGPERKPKCEHKYKMLKQKAN